MTQASTQESAGKKAREGAGNKSAGVLAPPEAQKQLSERKNCRACLLRPRSSFLNKELPRVPPEAQQPFAHRDCCVRPPRRRASVTGRARASAQLVLQLTAGDSSGVGTRTRGSVATLVEAPKPWPAFKHAFKLIRLTAAGDCRLRRWPQIAIGADWRPVLVV